MRVIASYGREELATAYIAKMKHGKLVEFVESTQPPIPREEKWVLIVSTMYGCPVRCLMCDAGGAYKGALSADEILAQVDYMVTKRFPDRSVPIPKFKVQFARMGEPALNGDVLSVLRVLPTRYRAPGLMPCISTIAPDGTDDFFRSLARIKTSLYSRGLFQLQFSIHTTDETLRERLIPIKKWTLRKIAAYADDFVQEEDRKVTLNFAPVTGMPIDAELIRRYFSPERFLIKMTPVNPTYSAHAHGLNSYIDPYHGDRTYDVVEQLRSLGYEVLVSIGELEENLIGTNCGQYVLKYLQTGQAIDHGYRSHEYRRDD